MRDELTGDEFAGRPDVPQRAKEYWKGQVESCAAAQSKRVLGVEQHQGVVVAPSCPEQVAALQEIAYQRRAASLDIDRATVLSYLSVIVDKAKQRLERVSVANSPHWYRYVEGSAKPEPIEDYAPSVETVLEVDLPTEPFVGLTTIAQVWFCQPEGENWVRLGRIAVTHHSEELDYWRVAIDYDKCLATVQVGWDSIRVDSPPKPLYLVAKNMCGESTYTIRVR